MKSLWIFSLIWIYSLSSAQTTPTLFEGVITYEYQIKNPNKQLISDEEFYRELPNKGKSTYKMYLNANQYRIDYANRTEIYQPASRRVMIYPNDKNEDSFYFVQVDIVDDKLESINPSDKTEMILNYNCKSIVTKNKWDTKTFYYAPQVLKVSASWKTHLKDDLGPFVGISSCFPLKIEGKGPFGNYTIKAVKIEPKVLRKELFMEVKGKVFYDDILPLPNNPILEDAITPLNKIDNNIEIQDKIVK